MYCVFIVFTAQISSGSYINLINKQTNLRRNCSQTWLYLETFQDSFFAIYSLKKSFLLHTIWYKSLLGLCLWKAAVSQER